MGSWQYDETDFEAISINYVDRQRNEVWFLIQLIGDGTRQLGEAKAGDTVNVVLPLGNGFTMP